MGARLRGSWIEKGHVLVDGCRPNDVGVAYLLSQAEEIE